MFDALIVFVVGCLAVYVGFQVALYKKSRAMKRREVELRENGVTPSGSGLCHGIVIDKTNKRRVVHDEKPSDSWFKRLA
ncbi:MULTISPECIES: hypothetical protein [Idiomarinaceae]|uniref:Uncharacterized protein n=1 Tax=Idiomarina baltica OS145 TaxID=314276 RepID=A0ABP2CRT4_9GAMM|nr:MULTISPECIES: hypothetical protein [Idiomarinaceae]EAQ32574.1 hypothetical protein OS145_08888 [Idiomarina baltica OS145]